MNVRNSYFIIEDEALAADELKFLLGKCRPQWQMAGCADGVETAVRQLSSVTPDIIFSDIQLSDGLCFDIFRRQDVDVPIIFTTAYDEYALSAFKLNSIDYLLKPIDESELVAAIEKFERNQLVHTVSENMRQAELGYATQLTHSRFMVHKGERYTSVNVDDICCFYSEDKCTFLQTLSGKRYIVDYSLGQLQAMLDPERFCLVSRNCIAGIQGVAHFTKHFAGRLKLTLEPSCPVEIMVSRSRVPAVLAWLNGEVGQHNQDEA